MNLIKDFNGVWEWITACTEVPKEHMDRLSNHEALRMCEGVGKILLRRPEEIIPMAMSKGFVSPGKYLVE